MEGSSSPMKIDFTPLISCFERLDRSLRHAVLHTINDHVTLQVQQLMAKQEAAQKICSLILRIFFDLTIIDNAEIATNNWQEFAALRLLLCWFTSEQEKLEKNLVKIADVGLISGVGNEFLGVSEAEDPMMIEDSSAENGAAFVTDLSAMLQKMETLLSGGSNRMEKSELETHNNDGRRLNMILAKACWIDNRIGPVLLDLFCVLKMYQKETTPIMSFQDTSKESLKDDHETRFFIKIVEMLDMADKELKGIEQWWKISVTDGSNHRDSMVKDDMMEVDKQIKNLWLLMWHMGNFTGYSIRPEPYPVNVGRMESCIAAHEKDIDCVEVRVNLLRDKVKDGLFIRTMVALGHTIRSIESIKL